MKSYVAKDQLRLVGKAWEIRYQLRKLAQQPLSDITLKEALHRSIYSPSVRSKHAPLTHTPLENTQDLG